MLAASNQRHVPALDGFRGIACLLVVAFHSGVVAGASIGVDLFFVLSGFLITSVLLAEHRRGGRLALGRFFARRALRLLPALYVFVALALAIASFVPPRYLFGELALRAPLAALLYASNWAAVTGGHNLGVLQPTWSLAVEEQFYVVWPLILLFFMWLRLSSRAMALIALVLAVGSAVLRFSLWREMNGPFLESAAFYREYVASDTRAYALLVGCALAMVVRWPDASPRKVWRVDVLAFGAAALIAYIVATYDYAHESAEVFAVPVAGAGIIACARSRDSYTARLLAIRPLVWLCQRSYGIYLWHAAAFGVVDADVAADPYGHPPSLMQLALMWGAALAIGSLSYAVVERPFLRIKARLGAPARAQELSGVTAVGAGVSLP